MRGVQRGDDVPVGHASRQPLEKKSGNSVHGLQKSRRQLPARNCTSTHLTDSQAFAFCRKRLELKGQEGIIFHGDNITILIVYSITIQHVNRYRHGMLFFSKNKMIRLVHEL